MGDSEQVTFGTLGVTEDVEQTNRDVVVMELGKACDDALPVLSREGGWPVRYDHCFRRLVYDAACGGYWKDHVDGDTFIHDADKDQLVDALKHAARLLHEGSEYAWELQEKSLLWRGEMEPEEAEHVDPEVVL